MKKQWLFMSGFSGADLGGFGFLKTGYFKHKISIDWWSLALKAHQHMFPGLLCWEQDMYKFSLETLNAYLVACGRKPIKPGDIKVLLLSPSCKKIAKINTSKTRSPFCKESMAMILCARIIEILQPSIAIIEMVDSIDDEFMAPLYYTLDNHLNQLTGYNRNRTEGVLDAADFNVLQHRKRRIWFLAKDELCMPVLPKPVTQDYEALKMTSIIPGAIGYCANLFKKRFKDPITGRQIAVGERWTTANKITGTHTASSKKKIMERTGIRTVTKAETMKIVGAEDYDWGGVTEGQAQELAGNAIMPRVSFALALECLRLLGVPQAEIDLIQYRDGWDGYQEDDRL